MTCHDLFNGTKCRAKAAPTVLDILSKQEGAEARDRSALQRLDALR